MELRVSDQRVCAEDGCGVHLSRYRPNDDYCSAHAGPKRTYESLFPSWTRDAACRGMDFARFDVDLPTTGRLTQPVIAAKRVCASCPVWRKCLDFAFDNEFYADVVFGGLTGRERMTIRNDAERMRVAEAVRLHQQITYRLVPLGQKGEVA